MINVEYGYPFFIKNENKYNLTKNKISNITDNDFTFLVRVKPDWDYMKPGELTSNAGIIMKNGQHIGIVARKYLDNDSKEQCAYEAGVFTDNNEGKNFFSTHQPSNNPDDFENLALVHNKKEKLIIFKIGDKKYEFNYEGNIIDYSNAWIWIGAGSGFSEYPAEHKNFFQGKLVTIGIFEKSLNDDQILEYFSNFNDFDLINNSLSPLFFTNFINTTPYKIKDESGNGHNLIKTGFDWYEQ